MMWLVNTQRFTRIMRTRSFVQSFTSGVAAAWAAAVEVFEADVVFGAVGPVVVDELAGPVMVDGAVGAAGFVGSIGAVGVAELD